MLYTCVWEGNVYTDVRIFGDFYNHLPLSRLQCGVPLGRLYIHQTLCPCKLTSNALYNELLISVTYLVCAVCLTDTANNVFVGKD